MREFIRNILLLLLVSTPFLIIDSPAFADQSVQTVRDIEGTLEIRAASFLISKQDKKPSEVIEYALRVNAELVYSLQFTGKEPTDLKTGQRVKIKKGLLQTSVSPVKKLVVSPADLVVAKELGIQAMPDAFGPQKTLVILVNFQDKPSNEPWTVNQIKNTVFTVGNAMINEFSYQQTTVVGNVVGWYTIALPSNTTCESITYTLPTLARNAATAAGVNLSLYNRFIYMFPYVSSCQWAGLASIGGKPSTAWINGLNRVEAIVHEFGHNLGLYHSHSLECVGASNQGRCVSQEYGDLADTMGYPYTYLGPHFNAFQKERLGWLNYASSPPIQTVTTSGTYTINLIENAIKNVKALKIPRTANVNANDFYYLEYRQGVGFDKYMPTCTDCDFTKGVLVHQGNSSDGNSGYMLDMSPLDNNKTKLVTLLPGNSFTDVNAPNGGVTFSVTSVSTNSATVKVIFGKTPPTDCVRSMPRVQINPGYTVVKPGQTARFDASIINTDSAGCPSSNFTYTVTKIHDQIPVSWTPVSATLAAGATQNVTITAISNTSTPTGFYDVRFTAVNAAIPSTPGFTIGTLEVRK